MNLEYYRGVQKAMPKKTVWCVEVKYAGGAGTAMHLQAAHRDFTADMRIFSNREKALKWIDIVKGDPSVWTDNAAVNCFQVPADWFEWPHDPAEIERHGT